MQPEKWKLVSKSGLLKTVFIYFFCIHCLKMAKISLIFVTLFEILNFCPKIQLWFSEKIFDFFVENVVVLGFSAVDNFDFTRKIVKKNWLKNSWKCWGSALFSYWQLWFPEKIVTFCQNWIIGQKFDFSNSVRVVSRKL